MFNQPKIMSLLKKRILATPGMAFLTALVSGIPALWFLKLLTPPDTSLAHPSLSLLFFLKVILVFPLLEEYLFRGVLQDALANRPWGKHRVCRVFSSANIITSLVFTAAHTLYHSPLWAASVFIPSLLFGCFKDQYGTITYSVLLHMLFNGGYYVWVLR